MIIAATIQNQTNSLKYIGSQIAQPVLHFRFAVIVRAGWAFIEGVKL